MPDSSSRLALPYLLPAQAQKHVTHNEALSYLDVLVQLSVVAFDAETPPAAPAEGDAYALGAAPTGDWAGHASQVAAFINGGWVYFTPQTGWRAWGEAEQALRVWTGVTWADVGGTPDFDNLSGVGVNAASDLTNRLAVSAPATLLSHEGAGHQLKVNKASASDTASLLFQSNWSGRAEMGLSGSDDFTVKVSPDGSTFSTGLTLHADTAVTEARALSGSPVLLDDDTATMLTPPLPCGFVLVTVSGSDPRSDVSAILVQDSGATPALQSLFATTSVELLGTTPLSGTSAGDGMLGLSVVTGGLWIENRLGSTQSISVTFLGGL